LEIKRYEGKLSIIMLIILLTLMFLVFSFMSGTPLKAVKYIEEGGLMLIYSFLLIVASEIVKSFRYYLLGRKLRRSLSLKESILVQFIGYFANILTPGGIGGIPASASLLSSYADLNLGESLGYATLQSFFDITIPVLISLYISFYFLPKSILLILFSLLSITLWISAFSLRVKNFLIRLIKKIIKRDMGGRIENEISTFQNSLKIIWKEKELALYLFLITLVAYFIQAFSINMLYVHVSILRIFTSLMFFYVMASFPTPGGEGGVEYGLSFLLPLKTVIEWRALYVFSALLSGIFLIFSIKDINNYINKFLDILGGF